jgi:hypothetical protein
MTAPQTNRERKMFLSRAKAERELSAGADPRNERYTKHQNKHVRAKAAHMATRAAATL